MAIDDGYPTMFVAAAHASEDMREWGVSFSPKQPIAVLDQHASGNRLPEVAGSVVTAAEAVPAG